MRLDEEIMYVVKLDFITQQPLIAMEMKIWTDDDVATATMMGLDDE